MNNIKKFRALAGMKQIELAEQVGICRGGLIVIEEGRTKNIRKETLDNLCKVFKTTPVMLLGQDNFRYLPSTKEEIDYVINLLNSMKEGL